MDYIIEEKEYGKSAVKLLFVDKSSPKHEIFELQVETSLTLSSEKDYRTGDNADIIATDSQKNTVYILAKQYGIKSPEQFGILLAEHFIKKYAWVVRARIIISMLPWANVKDNKGREHNHAYVKVPVSTRVAEVVLNRFGGITVTSGIRDLTVLKTTQSAFVNFVNDEYRSLPDMDDRIFSTIVTADWAYNNVSGLNFDKAFRIVEETIIENFAGPADTGIASPSVQNTQFLTQKSVMEKIPQVEKMHIKMPNRHYFPIDLSKFPIPGVHGPGAGEVLLPVDHPSGQIASTLTRNQFKSKL